MILMIIASVISLAVLHGKLTALRIQAVFASSFVVKTMLQRIVLSLIDIYSAISLKLLGMINFRYVLYEIVVDFWNNTL